MRSREVSPPPEDIWYYEARIALLTTERNKLREESEFYVPIKKPLPAKLACPAESTFVMPEFSPICGRMLGLPGVD